MTGFDAFALWTALTFAACLALYLALDALVVRVPWWLRRARRAVRGWYLRPVRWCAWCDEGRGRPMGLRSRVRRALEEDPPATDGMCRRCAAGMEAFTPQAEDR
jgi:hypothetical protein